MRKKQQNSPLLRGVAVLLSLVLCLPVLPVTPAARAAGNSKSMGAAILESIGYHGDANACTMTAAQAAAFAQALRDIYQRDYRAEGQYLSSGSSYVGFAALFHVGNGNAAVLAMNTGASSMEMNWWKQADGSWAGVAANSDRESHTLEYINGQAAITSEWGGYYYENCEASSWGYDEGWGYTVQLFGNGRIKGGEEHTADVTTEEMTGKVLSVRVDGVASNEAGLEAWKDRYWPKTEPVCGATYFEGGTPFTGLYPLDQVVAGLEAYAALKEPQKTNYTTAELLGLMGYCGDTTKCRMTPEQAAAFLDTLEHSEIKAGTYLWGNDVWYYTDVGALLCDLEGNGIPALLIDYCVASDDDFWMGMGEHSVSPYLWDGSRVTSQPMIRWDGTYGTAASEECSSFGENIFGGYSWVTWSRGNAGAHQNNRVTAVKGGAFTGSLIETDYPWEGRSVTVSLDGMVKGTFDLKEESAITALEDTLIREAGGPVKYVELHPVATAVVQNALRAYAALPASELKIEVSLDMLPICGDSSRSTLTAKQAEAYANIIETVTKENAAMGPSPDEQYGWITYEGSFTKAALLSSGGTGAPLLWVVAGRNLNSELEGRYTWPNIRRIYQWDNGQAVLAYDMGQEKRNSFDGEQFHATTNSDGQWYVERTYWRDMSITAGKLDFAHQTLVERLAMPCPGQMYGAPMPPRPTMAEVKARYGEKYDYSTLKEDMWTYRPAAVFDAMYYVYYADGSFTKDYPQREAPNRGSLLSYYDRGGTAFGVGYYQFAGPWADGTATASLLRAYAQSAVPGYTGFADLLGTGWEGSPTDAALAAVKGEVAACYSLTDGMCYVLVQAGEDYRGVLVQARRQGGKVSWHAVRTDNEPAAQEDLAAAVSAFLTTPNLTVDFDKLRGKPTVKDLGEYLRSILTDMEGKGPNDPAKSQLSAFLESALTGLSSGSVSGKDNRLALSGDSVAKLAAQAREAQKTLEGVLSDADVTLNKGLTVTLRTLWENVKEGAPCQVDLATDLANSLSGCDLQVLLGDARHYFQFAPDALRSLGSVSVQLSQTGENTYALNFLDGSGQVLEKVSVPVTVALPADSAAATVMASYAGGSGNWGGQYDANNGVIVFDARYSGQYEVLTNDVAVSDIDALGEETQAAIRFLVSKGYMDLEGDAFQPNAPLNRYEFTQALVGMFFALDQDAAATFPDVPKTSPYYPCVASGQARGIVAGLGDGTFGGERNITMQELLTLCGRTLADQKGYATPGDPDAYLAAFTDSGDVAAWARPNTALSVRERLIIRTGNLFPLREVTRQEAAIILYRLFLKLYEVSPVALEVASAPAHSAGSSGGGSVALAALGGALGAVAVGAGVFFVTKKKKQG